MVKVLTNSQGKVYTASGKALLSPSSYPTKTVSLEQIYPSQPVVTINSTDGYVALPDYSVTNNTTGTLSPSGTYLCLTKEFNDFTLVGSPTIDYTTGEYKATSNSNYMTKGIPDISNRWELRIKIKTPASGQMSGQVLVDIGSVSNEYGYVFIAMNTAGNSIYLKTGNNSNANILPQAGFTVFADTTYWFKIVSDGSSTTSYASTTGFDSMTQLETVATATTINASTMKIGRGTGTSKGYFKGSFDLKMEIVRIITTRREKMTDWEKRLEFHEGCILKLYKCPTGHLTIGIGHNTEAREWAPDEKKAIGDWKKGITKNAAMMILRNDINICLEKLKTLGFWYYLDQERQYALLDMCFQLGWVGLNKFKKMLEGIRTKNYTEAARQCIDSEYARQCPTRAKRIAVLIKSARWVQNSSDLKDIKI